MGSGSVSFARAFFPLLCISLLTNALVDRVATGEHCQNRMMFKQLLQAGSIDVCQIDSCRLAGVNEILAVLLMSAKAGVPVCPHAGGVGLCEMVIHRQSPCLPSFGNCLRADAFDEQFRSLTTCASLDRTIATFSSSSITYTSTSSTRARSTLTDTTTCVAFSFSRFGFHVPRAPSLRSMSDSGSVEARRRVLDGDVRRVEGEIRLPARDVLEFSGSEESSRACLGELFRTLQEKNHLSSCVYRVRGERRADINRCGSGPSCRVLKFSGGRRDSLALRTR